MAWLDGPKRLVSGAFAVLPSFEIYLCRERYKNAPRPQRPYPRSRGGFVRPDRGFSVQVTGAAVRRCRGFLPCPRVSAQSRSAFNSRPGGSRPGGIGCLGAGVMVLVDHAGVNPEDGPCPLRDVSGRRRSVRRRGRAWRWRKKGVSERHHSRRRHRVCPDRR